MSGLAPQELRNVEQTYFVSVVLDVSVAKISPQFQAISPISSYLASPVGFNGVSSQQRSPSLYSSSKPMTSILSLLLFW